MMVRNQMYVLLIQLSAFLALSTQGRADDFAFELRCSEQQCYVDEPFWIDILVINTSTDTLELQYPAPETEQIWFKGKLRGREFGYEGMSMFFIERPTVKLAPNDTVINTLNIWKSFFMSETWQREPRTGLVVLSASYGGFGSRNEISFRIDKPEGHHENAYRLLRAYHDPHYDYPQRPTFDNKLEYLEKIVELYPETGYAEEAVWLLCLFGGGDASPRRQAYATMMIEEYPSSGYVRECLPKYLFKFDAAENDSVLRSLLSQEKPLRMRLIVSNRIRGYKYH